MARTSVFLLLAAVAAAAAVARPALGASFVLPAVDIADSPSASAITEALVAVSSLTGSESAVAEKLETILHELGWHVQRDYLADNPSRFNLYATPADQLQQQQQQRTAQSVRSPRILFNSHIDTVPPFLPPVRVGSKLFGRGTADAKASVAAQIVAATQLIKAGSVKAGDVGLLYVVGEEVDHSGISASNKLNLTPEFFIVGEPTESKLALGHKGIVNIRFVSVGKAAHSAYPERGVSAIKPLVELIAQLENEPWPVDPRLGPTTFNTGLISGGVASNVVPELATADVTIRISTTTQEVISRILPLAKAKNVTAEILTKNEPVTCDTIPGFETAPMSYGTDIPFFDNRGKTYLFGPGSILVAHSADEFVDLDEVESAVESYQRLMLYLLA